MSGPIPGSGHWLREQINKARLSRIGLCQDLGIDRSTLYRYECEVIPIPDNEQLKQKLADAIGLDAYPGSRFEKILEIMQKNKIPLTLWMANELKEVIRS